MGSSGGQEVKRERKSLGSRQEVGQMVKVGIQDYCGLGALTHVTG